MWDFLSGVWDSIFSSGIPGVPGAGVAAEAITMLTDYRMWRSLGWLLLGVLLIVLGFVIWNRHAIGSAAGAIAAAA